MANICRISFISIMILLLLTFQSSLSFSARMRVIQSNLLTLDEIVKADRARLHYLFEGTIEYTTNLIEADSLPLPGLPQVITLQRLDLGTHEENMSS
ncbi:hypothetical protein AALP_AA7G064200 [Arabis alpina]|uniref:Dirigent protein n=1 Tax=Arabis alpina TaxID=50452 RepID=A0A087GGB1_ARAAL|nr:hypothetical protein AALP_AA7G064200 [Arabis alpina]